MYLLYYRHSTTGAICFIKLIKVDIRSSLSNPDPSSSLDTSLADTIGGRSLPTSQTYVVVYDWNASLRAFSGMCRVRLTEKVQMRQKHTMIDSSQTVFLSCLKLFHQFT